MSNTSEFKFRTKGNANPKGKPRVFFTCHPQDFNRSFEIICTDILATHDCAVYYSEDMSAEIPEDNRETDLERMNLFVIPVTFRLLSQPNRAMDSDYQFAIDKNIPVLPIMMESGIDEFYRQPDKFGDLQYLSPLTREPTEICYEEKLKNYLGMVLISKKSVNRIRTAFDAYVFLSYRKKDRKYANKLMQLIHKQTDLRNIAVWYDEYLTPGEDYQKNIDSMLRNSKLFILLVTPNLLEKSEGIPNYVMSVEYPNAKSISKKENLRILPVEMEPTDKSELEMYFTDLPDCITFENESSLSELLIAFRDIKDHNNMTIPLQNYLIGLAYLNGIDVETDRKRGLLLILDAANSGNTEAINSLYEMYMNGIIVSPDYDEAVAWAESLVNISKKKYGDHHHKTLSAYQKLIYALLHKGDVQNAIELSKDNYEKHIRYYGQENRESLAALNNYAAVLWQAGMIEDFKSIIERGYSSALSVLGEDHLDTITSLNNWAIACYNTGETKKALELMMKVLTIRKEVLGEEHEDTLLAQCNFACMIGDLGDKEKELALEESAFSIAKQTLGVENQYTLVILNNIANTLNDLKDHSQALRINQEVYDIRERVLGETHPETITSLVNIATTYYYMGKYEKAIEYYEKASPALSDTLESFSTIKKALLVNMAASYIQLNDYPSAAIILEQVFLLSVRLYGKNDNRSKKAFESFLKVSIITGEKERALKMFNNI